MRGRRGVEEKPVCDMFSVTWHLYDFILKSKIDTRKIKKGFDLKEVDKLSMNNFSCSWEEIVTM